jgi:Raf kinase inhibitor-like YbhB/YbcL family protein
MMIVKSMARFLGFWRKQEGVGGAGWRVVVMLGALILATGCASGLAPVAPAPSPEPVQPAQEGGAAMKLTSSAFSEGEMIPTRYTCDGADVSPPLAWGDAPAGTKALALICDDPDAPAGTWVHWVLINLPASTSGLPEGVSREKSPPTGGINGTTSGRRIGYNGPCPPSGTHRYYFKLYALDGPLALTNSATAKDVQAAMKGHILAEAQLMGRYKR